MGQDTGERTEAEDVDVAMVKISDVAQIRDVDKAVVPTVYHVATVTVLPRLLCSLRQ